jgi:hypothetical protein
MYCVYKNIAVDAGSCLMPVGNDETMLCLRNMYEVVLQY